MFPACRRQTPSGGNLCSLVAGGRRLKEAAVMFPACRRQTPSGGNLCSLVAGGRCLKEAIYVCRLYRGIAMSSFEVRAMNIK
jgi:hypothetical protein